jgi:hypothetical protein
MPCRRHRILTLLVLPLILAEVAHTGPIPSSSPPSMDIPDPFSDPNGDFAIYRSWWTSARHSIDQDGDGGAGMTAANAPAGENVGSGWIGGWFSAFGEGQMTVMVSMLLSAAPPQGADRPPSYVRSMRTTTSPCHTDRPHSPPIFQLLTPSQ